MHINFAEIDTSYVTIGVLTNTQGIQYVYEDSFLFDYEQIYHIRGNERTLLMISNTPIDYTNLSLFYSLSCSARRHGIWNRIQDESILNIIIYYNRNITSHVNLKKYIINKLFLAKDNHESFF